jgi:hypothetical protein
MVVFFFGGDVRRRGGRLRKLHEGSRVHVVIFILLRVLTEAWLRQLYSYPYTCLYPYACMLVFLT